MPDLRRVLVIAKRSAYDIYVRRHQSERVLDLLARGDPTVARLERADEHHGRTLVELREALDRLGARVSYRERERVGDTSGYDLVITVGGDGTLLWVSHAVGETPVLGVNSAPMDSVGYLCGARMGDVGARLEALARGELPRVRVARMRVSVDGRAVHRRVLNDALFAHPNPAMTSRYLLDFRGRRDEHKSSGIWLSTPAGSTAAVRSAGGRAMPLRSRLLQFVVREPYTPTGEPFAFERDYIRPDDTFTVLNKMREARIYLDGPRLAIPVEMGQRVTFDLSDEPLTLLGVQARATSERRKSAPGAAAQAPVADTDDGDGTVPRR